MAQTKSHDEKLQKLDTLLRSIGVAMLTTADAEGRLHSRPMHLQGGLEDGRLHFFAYSDSPKVHELESDHAVNCAFASPSSNEYVSIAGTARVTRDRKLMEARWSTAQKAWFPQGLETPGICMIQVQVEDAQFWDAPNQAMIHLYGMLKAAVTGQGAQGAGDVQKVQVRE